jgi:hypothetical protein
VHSVRGRGDDRISVDVAKTSEPVARSATAT